MRSSLDFSDSTAASAASIKLILVDVTHIKRQVLMIVGGYSAGPSTMGDLQKTEPT
jgi:hypothetical protein